MNRFYAKWIVCSLCMALGAQAYAQGAKQVVTADRHVLGASVVGEVYIF